MNCPICNKDLKAIAESLGMEIETIKDFHLHVHLTTEFSKLIDFVIKAKERFPSEIMEVVKNIEKVVQNYGK